MWKKKQKAGESDPLLESLSSLFPPEFKPSSTQPEFSGKFLFLDGLLREMVQTTTDRIVLVSNYTKTLDVMAKLCKARKYGYLRLDGDTTVSKRQTLVDKFNKTNEEKVFLLSSKAGGVGINLIGANRLVLFDSDWNPALDLQAMARVWRDGQKKQVYIYRLLSTGTIEEKIFQRQVTKQGLSTGVVDEKTAVDSLFSQDELKALFKLNNNTICETHDLLACTSCSATEGQAPTKKVLYTKKKSSMQSLTSWEHYDDVDVVDDDVLRTACPDVVTFVFSRLEVGQCTAATTTTTTTTTTSISK